MGTKLRVTLLCMIILQILILTPVYSQRIKANVTITIENLPLEKQEKLKGFQETISNYVNGYEWAKEGIDIDLPLSMQIFFESDVGTSFEDRYRIQILVSNNSDAQYFDKRCQMEYQQGEILVHNENSWDSLTGLLDFYIYLIIGEEMDKFGHLMGTPYFEKSKTIAEQAKFGMGRFIEGWDIRNDLVLEILSDKNLSFRKMKDFYFYGIYYVEEDPVKARRYCKAAVDMIEEILDEKPDHEKAKKFLAAHYIELIDLFKDAQDKEIFEQLSKLDPEHEDIYKEYLEI